MENQENGMISALFWDLDRVIHISNNIWWKYR